MIPLHQDFKEFLKCCRSKDAEFLLIGGYALSFHGHTRATLDMDIWVGTDPANAQKIADAAREFGFVGATPEHFKKSNQVIRMGIPPMRLEILTTIDGVDFAACYARRVETEIDGMIIPIISIEDLKINKAASGRLKDLSDLEFLK